MSLKTIIEDYLINNKNKLKINSNDILSGDVFVALQGKNNHGNIFVGKALDNGARFIITDRKSDLDIKYLHNITLIETTLHDIINDLKTQPDEQESGLGHN